MRDFKKIGVWQRSMDFSVAIYERTRCFPKEELYSLTSQIRRASTSIAINIAEGCGRNTNKDFIHFLHIAEGSASEVECELELAHRLRYLSEEDYNYLNTEICGIRKMLRTYKDKVQSDI